MKKLVVCSMACAFGLTASVAATNPPKDSLTVPLVTNFVAQGETATWSEDTSLTADTTVQKTGGGTLVVPASQTGFAAFKLDAAEGAIEFQNDLATARAADRREKDRQNVHVGVYSVPRDFLRDDAHVADLAECKVDSVWGTGGYTDSELFDIYQRHGIKVFASTGRGWSGGQTPGGMAEALPLSVYEQMLKTYRTTYLHPAIAYLSNGDEPSALDFEHHGKVCALIDKTVPETPTFLNLLPNYANANQLGTSTYQEYIDQYCEKVPTPFICYDHYMMVDDAHEVKTVRVPRMYENYRIVADACRRTGREFWYIAQMSTYPTQNKCLSLNQLRYQAWTSMAFGAVSIRWWIWSAKDWKYCVYDAEGNRNAEQFAKMKAMNAEIKAIGGHFMRFKNTATRFVDFGEGYEEAAANGAFSAVRATDESPILVGEMVARNGKGAEAIFVVAAGDPMDESQAAHTVRFTATGNVAALGPDGAPIVLTNEGNDTYSLTLADNACALITKDYDEALYTEAAGLSDAIKDKLGLWVSLKDKAHIVPVTEGGAEIERWYDVRETDIANPKYVYLQAEHADGKPGPSVANPLYVRKCSTETNTLELAYFGGYSSGISMKFLNPNGTAYKKRPMEMSTVYGYTSIGGTFGYLYGNCMATGEHRLWNENSALPWQSVWASVAGDTRIWIDGKTVDRSIGTLPYGFHVLHTRVNTLPTTENLDIFENALFSINTNERANGTKGGQYVGEIMFFTTRLTAAERAEVQRYLDRKWFGRRVPTTQVTLESGAELDVVAEDTAEIDLQATGDGAFVKKGDGTLVYRPKAFANGPSAAATIEGGTIEATRAISVAATAGMTVSSAIPTTLNGEMLTTGAADQADAVEKVGLGSAAIGAIPEGTKAVHVKAGTLAFRPAPAPVHRYEVAIPNGDFSDWGGDTTHGNVYAQYGGWSYSGTVGFCHYDRWFTAGGAPFGASVLITAFGYDVCPPVEGKCFLHMKVCGCTAKVDGLVIPEAGEYELSMLATSRQNSYQRSRVKIYLTDGGANEIYCGTITPETSKVWEQKTIRFSVPEAGAYTLHFDHQKWYDGTAPDAAVLINALHLYRIGDRANAWKIPNGDFENPSGVTTTSDGGRISYIDGTATIAGWEFDNTNTGDYGSNPPHHMMRSGLTDSHTYCEGGRRWGSGFNNSQWPLGGLRQALIRRDGGWVKATFMPPKGKWYLKADMAYWGEYSTADGGPKLLAELTGGVTADLGAITVPKSWTMQPQVWMTPFEADGKTEVTLTLTFQSYTTSPMTSLRGVNLDDFELVGEYEHPYELISNGDFELPVVANGANVGSVRTGWENVRTTKFTVTNETTGAGKTTTLADNIPREYGRDNWAFGTDYGSGDYFMEPYNSGGGVGGFYQTVTFPHAGWYRLSYLVKSRYNASQNDRLVEVDLIDVENGVTNRIDSIHRMTRGVYCQRTALFRIDGACTRNLAFLCPVQSGDYPAFDDVSVRFLGETYEAALATPDPEEKGLIVNVAKGAYLQLDFTGTNRVTRFIVDGVGYRGIVDKDTCPAVFGAGTLNVVPRDVGGVILVR